MSKDKLYIAQLDMKLGAIEKNFKKIEDTIKKTPDGSLIFFQKSAIIGYPLFSMIQKYPILIETEQKYLNKIIKPAEKRKIIIGTSNGILYIENGKSRYINQFETIKIGEDKYKVTDDYENFNSKEDFDILAIIDSEISRAGSEYKKHNKFSSLAKKIQKPIIYINQTGSTDSLSFDGASRAYNKEGKLTACAEFFKEDLLEINLNNPQNNRISPLQEKFNQDKKDFSLDYSWDIERTYLSTIQTIKSYFEKNCFKKAVLGLSGGLDSSVCAALLSDALGGENVIGISMPSKISSQESKDDAQKLAKNLGINFKMIPIKDMVDEGLKSIKSADFDMEKYEKSFTKDNIQARSRATILWGISNEYKDSIPIATCDKSEDYMGYSTINGDMSGGFSPIGDITKTKAFALAKYINREQELIPNEIILKKPTAELEYDDKKGKFLYAEEALMPYEFLDEAIWHFENSNCHIEDMMKIEFIYEKKNKISTVQKKEWLQKFFKRIQGALYKWSITPAFPITDKHSLSSLDGANPISVEIPNC